MNALIIVLLQDADSGEIVSNRAVSEGSTYEWLKSFRKEFPEELREEIGFDKTFTRPGDQRRITLRKFELDAYTVGGTRDGAFAATMMAKMLNTFSEDEVIEPFIKTMQSEHLTLQQTFMRFVLAWIKAQANPRYIDGRNEASVNLAKAIMDHIEDEAFCLPLV